MMLDLLHCLYCEACAPYIARHSSPVGEQHMRAGNTYTYYIYILSSMSAIPYLLIITPQGVPCDGIGVCYYIYIHVPVW